MKYQVLVLDLDGTLTNSKKEISAPTKQALLEIQEAGKTVVLASGRPIRCCPSCKRAQNGLLRRLYAFLQRRAHNQMFHRGDHL